jgi:hypothetical protein
MLLNTGHNSLQQEKMCTSKTDIYFKESHKVLTLYMQFDVGPKNAILHL